MWFRRRRRRSPPPILLPSLDRLAELIERVVALLDEVSLAPEPAPRGEIVLNQHNPGPAPAPAGWLAFVHSADGYRLLEQEGEPPARNTTIELDGGAFTVLRLGPSPLPGDRRRCAFVEQEPSPAERTFDR
jgi:hypothetical protein